MSTIDAYVALGQDREFDLTTDALLRALDAAAVEQAVISPVDRCLAVYNRDGNDAMQRAATAHPDRLIPACTVNPWYGDAAVEELRRSHGEGAQILVLHPAVQGFLADDDLVWPVLQAASEARMLVYIHTGPPGHATPWQVAALAHHFPSLTLIMGHCGATDFWNDVIDATRSVQNIVLEASFARPFSFARYIAALGPERGIMGSLAPLNNLEFEWAQMRALLPPATYPGVYGDNLARLLVHGETPE